LQANANKELLHIQNIALAMARIAIIRDRFLSIIATPINDTCYKVRLLNQCYLDILQVGIDTGCTLDDIV